MTRLPMGGESQALKHGSVLAEAPQRRPLSLNLIYFKSGGRLTARTTMRRLARLDS